MRRLEIVDSDVLLGGRQVVPRTDAVSRPGILDTSTLILLGRIVPIDALHAGETDFDPLPFDAAAARAFGGVAASSRRTGRTAAVQAYDVPSHG